MPDATDLRRLMARLDTLHAFVYFRPEAGLNSAGIGLEGMDAYFASRAAPMGAVGPEVVVATFFNFNPKVVRRAVPAVWERATPETVVETRLRSADQALRKMLGDDVATSADVTRAADLLERVAAAADAPGRPLYAANAAVVVPDEPHLRLHHAATLLREHRGDAHVAALVLAGLEPVETLQLDVVSGRSKMAGGLVQATRGWSDEAWAEGYESLRRRGLIGLDAALNEDGLALREELERRTDEASLGLWSVLTDDEVAEVAALTDPLIRTVGAQMFGT